MPGGRADEFDSTMLLGIGDNLAIGGSRLNKLGC